MNSADPSQSQSLADFLAASLQDLSEDPANALQQIESIKDDMTRFTADGAYGNACKLLDSQSSFWQGLLHMQRGELSHAPDKFKMASELAADIGENDLATMYTLWNMYCSGVVELQKQNLTAGLELMKNAETQLSGTVDPRLRKILDHFLPDQVFAAGAIAIANGDLERGKVLTTEAASRAERVANTYHEDDLQGKSWLLGLAELYRSYFGMFQLIRKLHELDLKSMNQANELSRIAQHAKEQLSKGEALESVKQRCRSLASVASAAIDSALVAAPVLDAMLKRKLPPTRSSR